MSHFKPLCDILAVSGLYNDRPLSGWQGVCYSIYKYFTLSICLYGLEGMVEAALDSDFAIFYLGLCIINVWALLDSAFFLVRQDKVRGLLLKIARLDELFDNDPLSESKFSEFASKYNSKIQFYMKIYMISQTTLPLLNGMVRFLRSLDVIDLQLEVLRKNFGQFSIFYGVDVVVLMYCVAKQVSTDCFFISLFLHITLYFNHLHDSVPKIFIYRRSRSLMKMEGVVHVLQECPRGGMLRNMIKSQWNHKEFEAKDDEDNIKTWVKMHQEVLRYGSHFILVFTCFTVLTVLYKSHSLIFPSTESAWN